jgi:c(7)-type cytochrome triheme protein
MLILVMGVVSFAAVAVWAADASKDSAAPAAAAAPAAPDANTPPESLTFKKTGAMAPVKFPHAAHVKNYACKDCHEGDKPLFPKKFDDETGIKMADMYKGDSCGHCHDGKTTFGADKKAIFAAKTSCMKCHKKDAAAKQ